MYLFRLWRTIQSRKGYQTPVHPKRYPIATVSLSLSSRFNGMMQLGLPVCNALLAFGQERYEEVCDEVSVTI